MLPYPLELASVIILVDGASLLSTNMDAHCMEMFLVFNNKISLTMRKSQLIRPNTGVIWRRRRRRKKRKKKRRRRRRKEWKRRNLKMVFSLLIVYQVLPLEWRHLMLLTYGSNREIRSLRGLFIKCLKRKKKKLVQDLYLYPDTLMWLVPAPRINRVLKGSICLKVRSQIKWTSLYCRKSWKPWKMFCLPSMRKLGRKRSCVVSVRISVTWLQRMRRKEKEGCKKRTASRRRRTLSFSFFFFLSGWYNSQLVLLALRD